MKTAFLLILVLSFGCYASKEGVLIFSEIAISSNGIGSSGPIKLEGKVVNGKYNLKLLAFSKEYIIPDSIISKLKYSNFNGVRLSYENGYKDIGGKTVYIVFEFGFISRISNSLTISISENGAIRTVGQVE